MLFPIHAHIYNNHWISITCKLIPHNTNCVYFHQTPKFLPRTAEQFQRANPLSAPRIEMNVGQGSTSYMNIHKLKREVDSLKQRQQEIQSFNQVSFCMDV